MTTRDPSSFVADRAEREITQGSPPPAPTMPSPVTGGQGTNPVLQGVDITPNSTDLPLGTPPPATAEPWSADREAIDVYNRLQLWGSGSEDMFAEAMLAPVNEYVYQLTEQDPALRQLIVDYTNGLVDLSDQEMFDRVFNSAGPLDEPINSISDMLWEASADAFWTRRVKADSVASESLFTNLKLGFDTPPEGGEAFGAGFSLENATGWAMDTDGNLAITFGRRNQQGAITSVTTGTVSVDEDLTLVAKLDPDAKIETQLDLLGAIRQAAEDGNLRLTNDEAASVADIAEAVNPLAELGRNIRGTRMEPVLEGLGQSLRSMGGVFQAREAIGAALNRSGDNENRLIDEIAQNRTVRQMESVEQQMATIQHPRGFVLASLAVSLADEARKMGDNLSNSEAMSIIRQVMSDEEIDAQAENMVNMTQSQFFAEIERTQEDITAGEVVSGALGFAMEPTQRALEAWSDISRQIGVQLYDYVWDVQSGWVQVATGDFDEGLQRFQEAFTEPADFDLSPAQWFDKNVKPITRDEFGNIDNTSVGQGINLFTEFWADPTNLIGVGVSGGAARRLSRNAITDARLADAFTSLPEIRKIADDMVGDGDVMRALMAATNINGVGNDGWKLLDVALNPNATREEVNKAIQSMLPSTPGGGNFLGLGGATRSRSNSIGLVTQIDGLGNVAPDVLARSLDSKVGRRWTNYLVNATTERSISSVSAYEDIQHLILQLYHSDDAGLRRWFTELRDIGKKGGTLSDARLGEIGARAEDIKRGVAELETRIARAGYNPQQLQDAWEYTTQKMRTLPEDSEAFRKLQLTAAEISEEIRGVGPERADLITEQKRLADELVGIERLRSKSQLGDVNQALNDLVFRIYDDFAENRINAAYRARGNTDDFIPVKPGRGNSRYNQMAPGVSNRDWANVNWTGHHVDYSNADEVSRVSGAFGDDPEAALKASAVGMFNAQSHIPLPASPSELLLAEGLAGKKDALGAIQNRMRREFVKKVGSQWRSIWASLVLLNPETAIRTGLDEALGRFPLVTGDIAGTGKAVLASLPGNRWADKWITNSYVQADVRGGASSLWDTIEQTGDWVTKKGKWTQDGRGHVERFVNGSLIQDDVFQNFSRNLDADDLVWDAVNNRPVKAPQAWVDWWEGGGAANVRRSIVDVEGRSIHQINNADEAFEMAWDVWQSWLDNYVKPGKRDKVAGRILDAARGKAPRLDMTVDGDIAVMDYITKVQAQIPNEEQFLFGDSVFNPLTWTDRGWSFYFGNPARRRQGVIMQRLMDRNLDILREAHSKNGKFIVDAPALVERYGIDPEEAAWMVRQGVENPQLRQLMQDQGVTTMAELEKQAFVQARREARDMMYVLTATTRAGQAVDNPLIAPFFRAQTDFIGWWYDYLSRPLTMRLGADARQALSTHPMLQAGVQTVEDLPGPVNAAFRSFRGMSHFYGSFGGTSGEDQSMLERAVDRLTFLPGPWSDDFVTKLVPGVGLASGKAIDLAVPDDSTAQAIMEKLWPSIGWNTDSAVADLAFPNPTRGTRNMLAAAGKGLMSLLGYPPGLEGPDDPALGWLYDRASWVVNVLEGSRQPVGKADYESMLWSRWLAENAGSVRPGSEEWKEARDRIENEAAAMAYTWYNPAESDPNEGFRKGELAKDALAYLVPFYYSVYDPDLYSTDRLSLESFSGIMENQDTLDTLLQIDADRKEAGLDPIFEANLLYDDRTGDAATDFASSRLAQTWTRWREGKASVEDRQFLGDSLSDVFFNRLNDVEVWEGKGFTYRDFVLVTNPQSGMLLTQGLAPATRPTSAEGRLFWDGGVDANGVEQPPHVTADGTTLINIPNGPAGSDLRKKALTNGWVRERGFDERSSDAHNAYLSARSKIIKLMWEMQTGKGWEGYSAEAKGENGETVSGLPKSWRDNTFTPNDMVRKWADAIGMDFPGNTMSFQTYRETLETEVRKLPPDPFAFEQVMLRGPGQALEADQSGWGQQFMADLRAADRFAREAGFDRFEEWPQDKKEIVWDRMTEAYNRGIITRTEYDRDWKSYFGELNYKPPTPPPVSDLQISISARPNQVSVTDGDTMNIFLEDGSVPVRIIGLLAPESNQEGFAEATDNLKRLIENADEITFGVYDPQTFGTTQIQGSGRQRALMWLYVDGVPIWDRDIFTPESPTGSQGDARVSDLESIYNLGKSGSKASGK